MTTEDMKEDLPEVKELDDGSLQVGKEEKEVPEEDKGDERLTETKDDTSEEEGHADESEEEAEERRERNRARRAQNKASRKEYIESLKRELSARDEIINDLSTRVASVEQHSVGNQMAQIDVALTEAANYYNHFKSVNQKAIELADGATAVDAQEKMIAAKNRFDMLQNAKKNMGAKVQQPKPLDPRMAQNAKAWIEKNSWYDPSGTDQDSDLVMKLDNRLVQEGWNPTTSEYWDELDARVKKYLPHRTVSGYNKPQVNQQSRPRVPVGGSGAETSAPSSKGSYRLSAERVNALKEAGIYDDPAKRADAIKRFQLFDKEQANKSK